MYLLLSRSTARTRRGKTKARNMSGLLRLIPTNHISWLIGALVHLRLPQPFASWSVRVFSSFFGIDLSEASAPVDCYRCIGELFVRELKPEARPIPQEADKLLLSPIDGTLRACVQVKDDLISQIKGKSYSLSALLGEASERQRFGNGCCLSFYLSPHDYHHVHAPASAVITRSVHIPGALWPVNNWSLGAIGNLFSQNERLITWFSCGPYEMALVMVGAANVGRISVTYDDWCTNKAPWNPGRAASVRKYPGLQTFQAGQKLGTFHMGSAVILLCERGMVSFPEDFAHSLPRQVKFGEILGKLTP